MLGNISKNVADGNVKNSWNRSMSPDNKKMPELELCPLYIDDNIVN